MIRNTWHHIYIYIIYTHVYNAFLPTPIRVLKSLFLLPLGRLGPGSTMASEWQSSSTTSPTSCRPGNLVWQIAFFIFFGPFLGYQRDATQFGPVIICKERNVMDAGFLNCYQQPLCKFPSCDPRASSIFRSKTCNVLNKLKTTCICNLWIARGTLGISSLIQTNQHFWNPSMSLHADSTWLDWIVSGMTKTTKGIRGQLQRVHSLRWCTTHPCLAEEVGDETCAHTSLQSNKKAPQAAAEGFWWCLKWETSWGEHQEPERMLWVSGYFGQECTELCHCPYQLIAGQHYSIPFSMHQNATWQTLTN